MCGIAALLASDLPSPTALAIVGRALERIAHRGEPEFRGETWSMEGYAGGANRLPFTSGAEPQPASDASGRYRVFLNGELYSLHGKRDAHGGPMSDTRALAEDIARLGVAGAFRANSGMYAAIVVDSVARCAYLARDPFGIKPLYYARTPHGLIVASEIKALAPFPFVDEIEHVAPGAIMKIDHAGIASIDTVEVKPEASVAELSAPDYADHLADALLQSVRQHTRDSNQYGIYLSGGIDSSAIYALAKLSGVNVIPFVVGTPFSPDVAAAREVAAHFGDEIRYVDCPTELELFDGIDDVVRIAESFEPNVIRQSAVSLVLAQAAKAHGCRVVLCGEGADELLGGYPEFWLPGANFSNVRSSFLRDLHRTQLQRVDRVNMACTIEVRVPFLTPTIAAIALAKNDAASFSDRGSGRLCKLPLRLAMSGKLPQTILHRDKVVLSEGAGLRGNNPVNGMFSDILSSGKPDPGRIAPAPGRWKIATAEEQVYFNFFDHFGYSKYHIAAQRVFANATQTHADELIEMK